MKILNIMECKKVLIITSLLAQLTLPVCVFIPSPVRVGTELSLAIKIL